MAKEIECHVCGEGIPRESDAVVVEKGKLDYSYRVENERVTDELDVYSLGTDASVLFMHQDCYGGK